MNPEEKEELMNLLEERTLSSFERRKRRLQQVPIESVAEAVSRARHGLSLTRQQFIAAHLGFTPEELQKPEWRSEVR
jgi:hypothetical protein